MIDTLMDLLRRHDWTYQHSDDPGAWRRGNESAKAIRKEAQRVGRGDLVKQAHLMVTDKNYHPAKFVAWVERLRAEDNGSNANIPKTQH
jgi:hypothetical protein